jgi:hypothetical protein
MEDTIIKVDKFYFLVDITVLDTDLVPNLDRFFVFQVLIEQCKKFH